MKKLTVSKQVVFSFLLLLMMGTIFAFDYTKPKRVASQDVGIIFGNNRRLCLGVGVCTLMPPDRLRTNSYDALGVLRVGSDGSTTLEIKKNSISVAKAQEQFGDAKFNIEKDIEFSSATAEENTGRRGVEMKTTIKKGSFAVEEDEESYIIAF